MLNGNREQVKAAINVIHNEIVDADIDDFNPNTVCYKKNYF